MIKLRFLSFMMVLFVATSTTVLSSGYAYAEEVSVASSATQMATVHTGSCGTNATWSYNTETETLTISGTGAVEAYVENGATIKTPGWLANSIPYAAKHVIIEEGITSVGEGFCEYCFGVNTSGVLTLEVGESVKSMDLHVLLTNENVYFYGKTNSWFQYEVYKTNRFVSTGNALHEYIPTSGTYTDGAAWSYDTVTKTLTISGDGRITESEYDENFGFGEDAAEKVVFEKNVLPPEESSRDEYSSFLHQIIVNYKLGDGPEVCLYHDSLMAIEYEKMIAYYAAEYGRTEESARAAFPVTYVDDTTVSTLLGDANLDGEINLTDVILTNKIAIGTADMTSDIQQLTMDCNNDGVVTEVDGLALWRFLLQIEDKLPVDMA